MKVINLNSILNNNILRIMLGTVLVLLIPFVTMQFTDEVNWSVYDFVIAGFLLLGTGLMYEFTTRNVNSKKTRITIGLTFIALLIYIWLELAVGIFTNWGS